MLALQRAAGNRAVQALHTGSGGPLVPPVRRSMEASFGADLADVRVHTDGAAAAACGRVGAQALTTGNDVYFGPGGYAPETAQGRQVLAHELAHVLQQRAGRVAGAQGHGATLRTDPALEREADAAGERAARGQPAALPHRTGAAATQRVYQPKLGFEIEMLVLVDIDGRPLPEKIPLGTYGTENIELTVDHSDKVTAPTPQPASRSTARQIPRYKGGPIQLGGYDLPPGSASRLTLPTGTADTRPVPRWLADDLPIALSHVSHEFSDLPSTPMPVQIPQFDVAQATDLAAAYRGQLANWASVPAAQTLQALINLINAWCQLPQPNDADRRRRFQEAANSLQTVAVEATTHRAFWTGAGAAPPPGATREYRTQTAKQVSEWSTEHPVEQYLGGETYHSILEIVTRAYDAETPAGGQAVVTALAEAAALAGLIHGITGGLTQRAALNTAAGTTITNPGTHVGNPAAAGQSLDASVQSTFAVDLAQLPSLMQSVLGKDKKPNPMFSVKHHGDRTESQSINEVDLVKQQTLHPALQRPLRSVKTKETQQAIPKLISMVLQEAARAPDVASAVLKQVADSAPVELATVGLGLRSYDITPDLDTAALGRRAQAGRRDRLAGLANLRGLLTLVAQYLLMGRHFSQDGGGALDKNIVPLLSRTDLAHVYLQQVPGLDTDVDPNGSEKGWARSNWQALRAALLANAARSSGSMLFTDATEAWHGPGRRPFTTSVGDFVDAVFQSTSDGVTPYLDEGLFKQMPAEPVHPAGSARDAEPRSGPVFELRNMTRPPRVGATSDRLPPGQWAPLAQYFVDLLTGLHGRTDADARTDTQILPGPTVSPAPQPWYR